MTEQQENQLVDSMNTLIDQIVDVVKLQAVIKVDDAMADLNEMKIREIAREEALDAVRDGDITVSIDAYDTTPLFGGGGFFVVWVGTLLRCVRVCIPVIPPTQL